MTKKEILKQYIPLLMLSLLAGLVVFLGAASVAHSQNYGGQSYGWQNQGGEVIADSGANASAPSKYKENKKAQQTERNRGAPLFKPLAPHQESRKPSPPDSMASSTGGSIFIGRAGELPPPPKPPKEEDKEKEPEEEIPSPEELKKMDSLADSSENGENADNGRLGPKNMNRARRVGDIKRMATDKTANPDFNDLHLNNKTIRTAKVQVHLKEGQDDKQSLLSWRMNPLEYPVFINKVQALEPAMSGNVSVMPPDTAYKRTTVELVGKDGTTYAPVRITQNRVRVPGKEVPRQDSGRELETWVLGTAKRRDQREIISNLINVMSYEQCKMLGHSLVDGAPRQCILPDGTTYIEIDEKLTPKAREITNFEKCLKRGHPIVDTFPRQCVAPGGRIYVEPPRL